MDRRTFTQSFALAALGVSTPQPQTAAPAAGARDRQAPPFPLSVMLWTVFTGMPFAERIARIADAGYSNVELVGEYRNWNDADFESARNAAGRLGIRFDATAGLRHGVADPGVRDAFLAELGAALGPMKRLDCPAMIVLSGNVVPDLTRDAQHQAAIETLKRAAALVEGHEIAGQPVRLLLECIDPEENPHYFLPSAAEAIEIVRAVNHPQVQFLYDLFHAQIAHGNLIERLEKDMDVIGLIHVADVPGRHEPGSGEINYPNIYRTLARLNYRHAVAMEFKPTGDPVARLRAARQMVLEAVNNS